MGRERRDGKTLAHRESLIKRNSVKDREEERGSQRPRRKRQENGLEKARYSEQGCREE